MTSSLPLLLAVKKADLLDVQTYTALYRQATASRRERTDRFMRREDKCRSIVGEALVRFILRERSGKELDDAMIIINQFGCPSIPAAGFNYSVSHSGRWVICAADTGTIGADVECMHKVSDGIAERFFCPEEVGYIDEGNSDAERQQRFFTLWVLKESYIKALGRGFNCPLSSFACLPDPSGSGWKLKRNDPTLPECFFTLHNLGYPVPPPTVKMDYAKPDGDFCCTHMCASCAGQPGRAPHLMILTPQDLVSALEK